MSIKTDKVLSKSFKFVKYLNNFDKYHVVGAELLNHIYNGMDNVSYFGVKLGNLVKEENH